MIKIDNITYLTCQEAADRLKLEYSYVVKLAVRGDFTGTIKQGRNRLIPESEVEKWEQSAVTQTVYRKASR